MGCLWSSLGSLFRAVACAYLGRKFFIFIGMFLFGFVLFAMWPQILHVQAAGLWELSSPLVFGFGVFWVFFCCCWGLVFFGCIKCAASAATSWKTSESSQPCLGK